MPDMIPAGDPAQLSTFGNGPDIRSIVMQGGVDPAEMRRYDRTLPEDAWKQIDQRIIQIARERLVLTGFLLGRGLRYGLNDFLGTPVLQTQKVSDMEAADITMEPTSRQGEGRIKFSDVYMPIPIIHKPISFGIRMLRASQKAGQPIDLTTFGVVMRKVMDRVEDVFINGANITVTVNSTQGTVYGLTNFPDRNTIDLDVNWDTSGKTGAQILADVQEMLSAARADNMFGPFVLLIPANYEGKLEDDYSTQYQRSIRSRLLELSAVAEILVVDQLSDDNVMLVQLSEDTVQVIDGQRPTVIPLVQNELFTEPYLGLACMLPYLKSDQDARCGIVHLRPAP